MKLAQMKTGQKGNILRIERGLRAERQLLEMGLLPGASIEVLSRQPLSGPVVIKVGNSRVALGRKLASAIEMELSE